MGIIHLWYSVLFLLPPSYRQQQQHVSGLDCPLPVWSHTLELHLQMKDSIQELQIDRQFRRNSTKKLPKNLFYVHPSLCRVLKYLDDALVKHFSTI
ncbi:CLUMA_CG013059, isoform A [Clunio marinus]|uniref:CLUMA_CG013059, isoform A n=1 Tax=Clunio marinus TaxID=568069 RepID=A0A1J1IHD6_9DIPT|nr:CLUMA_CG013059, isoform A [Clunio marinus]